VEKHGYDGGPEFNRAGAPLPETMPEFSAMRRESAICWLKITQRVVVFQP
jgi:hypothetical protein